METYMLILWIVVCLVVLVVGIFILISAFTSGVEDIIKKSQLEFLNWVTENCELEGFQNIWWYKGEPKTIKELLEIFNNLELDE
jgi:hypothetical protein